MIEDRLQRVRAHMQAAGLEQLIVTKEQDIFYLTGLWCNPHDRLDALIVTPDACRMLCYHLAVIEPEGCEVHVYHDTGRTIKELAALLIDAPTGVDGFMQSRFLLPLMQACPGIQFSISTCVERARMLKTTGEIDLLREAARITDAVFMDVYENALRKGMTELELGAAFSDSFASHGVGRFMGDPMVCMGPGSAEPHHAPGGYALKPGDTICTDTGKRIHGYYSDVTRTVFFQSVSKRQRHVYDTVLAANLAAIDAAKPGRTIREVHLAACRMIEKAGYGAYYPHKTSHGVGIDYHEEPFDVDGRELVLEPGMCFSIEPGIYLPGEFGVRIEDVVVMTETGVEVLNQAPKELRIMGK